MCQVLDTNVLFKNVIFCVCCVVRECYPAWVFCDALVRLSINKISKNVFYAINFSFGGGLP